MTASTMEVTGVRIITAIGALIITALTIPGTIMIPGITAASDSMTPGTGTAARITAVTITVA